MISIDSKQLQKHFADIPDPRSAQGQLHQLSDIILISILAVISGADDFTEIAVYGQAKEPWLKTFLELLDHKMHLTGMVAAQWNS